MSFLPLHELAVFDAIVRHGGIRPAARALGIAHSAVSRRLHILEQHAGEALILRTGTGSASLHLTPRGSALATRVRAALADLEAELKPAPKASRFDPIVVSTTGSFAARWLLPRLPQFRALHPQTAISIQVSKDFTIPGRAGIDLALRMCADPGLVPQAIPWMDEVIRPALHPALIEGRRTPPPLKTLTTLPLLQDGDPSTTWTRWARDIGPSALADHASQDFNASDLLIQAAAQGLGVALIRSRLAEDELRSGELVCPFGPYRIHLPQAYWIIPSKAAMKRASVRAFIAWLRAAGQPSALEQM